MEIFYEQFITKDYGNIQKKFYNIRHTLLILAIMSAIFVGSFAVIIFLFGYIMLGFIAGNIFLEYEYEITENELVITKIMNKKRRKIITTLNIEELVSAKNIEDVNNEKIKVVNACIENNNALKETVLIINKDSVPIGFKIAMDKKLLNMCRKINPVCFNNII